jgi:hypothetical protein
MDIRNREASLGLEATTKEEGDTSIVPIRRVTKATARNLSDPNHPGDCECNTIHGDRSNERALLKHPSPRLT